MPVTKESSRLAWLAAAVRGQSGRVAELLRRLTGLGAPGAIKPHLFGKFLALLDQVAVEREKEQAAISEIEAIEAKHRFQRKTGQLRRATAANENREEPVQQNEPAPASPRNGLLWFAVLCALFTGKPINQKKQGLTVD